MNTQITKCKDCKKEFSKSSTSNLCQKCHDKIEFDIKARDSIANPSAQKLDEINSQFNMHNTVYKNGEY